jgi:hypothetical protein
MITDTLAKISLAAILTVGQLVSPLPQASQTHELVSHEMSLEKRYYPVQKENILLNMAYLNGNVKSGKDVKWDEVLKHSITLLSLTLEKLLHFMIKFYLSSKMWLKQLMLILTLMKGLKQLVIWLEMVFVT